MHALVLTSFDQPPTLQDLPLPQPRAGEVQIEIAACGLNFADLLMLRGQYQERPVLPFIPGMEVSGRILALGPGVSGLQIGQRVAAFAGQGGLATHGCFPAQSCLAIPDTLPFAQAAGFMVAYGTSDLALHHRARLKPGETLLVLGAAGGVGLTAVELGAAAGARVIAVARGAEKRAIARAAGAAEAIDSDDPDLRARFKALGGVDVVFDAVGEPAASAALRALKPEGRYLVIGFASGEVPQFPANLLLVKNIDVIGLYWGGYLRFAPQVLRASLARLLKSCENGALHPHVSHQIPLERVTEGLDLLRKRRATGKIVITMPQGAGAA